MNNQSQRERNVTLIEKTNALIESYENIGIFSFNNLSVPQMEVVRKITHETGVKIFVVKNTILNLVLKDKKQFTFKKKQGEQTFITYANDPASCIGFLEKVKKKKFNVEPLCIVYKNKNILDYLPMKSLIKMKNIQGINLSLISVFKQLLGKVIKVIQLIQK